MKLALVDRLRALPREDRERILAGCTARQLAALKQCWREFWGRPDDREPGAAEGRGQLPPPGNWTWWVSVGGRSSGKTTCCAHFINEEAMRLGHGCRIHLLGASIDDARETMIEGKSGLLATAPPWAGIDWKPSLAGGTVTWRSGARARVFGADKPAKGRGPQCSRMWIDDPAAFGPHGMAVLQQLLLGFRERAPDGSAPRGAISTTPMDSEILRWILEGREGKRAARVVFSRSISDDNRMNVSDDFFETTLADIAGTEMEQQERYGVVDLQSTRKTFSGVRFDSEPCRVHAVAIDELVAVAIWCDPAISSTTKSCEVGLVVAGLTRMGHVVAIEDLSRVMNAELWPEVALDAWERWSLLVSTHIGVETNRGGNLNEALLRSAEKVRRLQRGMPGVSVAEIRSAFADRSKGQRAAPLVNLYRAGQLHHVAGLVELERQLRALDENRNDHRDRADAWVYAVLDLALGAYAVGGTAQPVQQFGPVPLGSISVGRAPAVQQREARASDFQMGVPAGWR